MESPPPEQPKRELSTTMRIDLLPEGEEAHAEEASVRIRPATSRRKRARHITITKRNRNRTKPVGGQDFQQLLQSVYDAALLTDGLGAVQDANPRAEQFLGRTRSDLTQLNVTDIISGTDDSHLDMISTALDSDRFILIQAYCVRHDGSLFPTEISINRLNLGDQSLLCFFIRDITLRKHTEERMRTGHAAIQNAGNGIAVADLQGTLTYVNSALVALFGTTGTGDLAEHDLRAFLQAPGRVDDMVAAARERRPWSGELTTIRPDADEVSMQVSVAPNLDDESHVIGLVLSFLDITKRKRAETELRLLMGELARSNRDLEQFAYVVSHDLQEPLRKITAFGDRLGRRCEGILPTDAADYLQRMQNAAIRMQSLIRALLKLSRVSTKARPFAAVELGSVLNEVLSDLETRMQKSGGTVSVNPLPTIEAEAVQMRQLFQNLIGNALKFHRPGVAPKVHITAGIDAPPPDDGTGPATPFCTITVADNGIGFEPRHLERIFGVFQRLHARDAYEGTGIGLAICRKIVERHGGTITAKGDPGIGAAFTVRLPLKQQEDAAGPHRAEGDMV